MRFFRALCAVLGALLIVPALPSASYANDAPTVSEAFVLTKDGQLVDTLTVRDPSRTMTESTCQPFAGSSTEHRVQFVLLDDAAVCHMQLMYTRAEDETEFELKDSGEFIMTARTDQTIEGYRRNFGVTLVMTSLSLSVEGDVKSSTAGAANSSMTYENRSFTVVTWEDSVPEVITVRGNLASGGDRAAAGGTRALRDPWGVTPAPSRADAAATQSSSDPSSSSSSSGPSIGLLIGLIVGLILVVLVGVFVVYAKRSKKSPAPPNTPAAKAGRAHGAPPARPHAPIPNERRSEAAPASRQHTSNAPSRQHTSDAPSRRAAPEAPARQVSGAPTAPSRQTPPSDSPHTATSAAEATLAQPTPRDTGFVWNRQSGPTLPQQAASGVAERSNEPPRRKRSRGGHRPAVFPETRPSDAASAPYQATVSRGPVAPQVGSGSTTSQPAVPPPGRRADRLRPPAGDQQAPVPAPESSLPASRRRAAAVPAAPEALAIPRPSDVRAPKPIPAPDAIPAPDRIPALELQPVIVPEPEPIVAPEPEPVAMPEPEPVAMPEPKPAPEPVAMPAPEAIPAPELQPVIVPEPEPVVAPEPEPVAMPEPEPVAMPEPEPLAIPEPEPVVAPEPEPVVAPEPKPVAMPEPEPVAMPEPEPVAMPEPEPVAIPEPEPVAMPEPVLTSFVMPEEDADLATTQMPQVRRVASFDWDMPAAPEAAPEPTPEAPEQVQTQAPGYVGTHAEGFAATPVQPATPAAAPAAPSAIQAPQSPQIPAAFQSDWNTDFSWNDEAREEQEAETKRRGRWPWNKRHKKQRDEENKPTLPDVNERDAATRMPIIAVDAQEDDWNDWQNWNSQN